MRAYGFMLPKTLETVWLCVFLHVCEVKTISQEFLDGISRCEMLSEMVFLGLGTSSVLAAYFWMIQIWFSGSMSLWNP